LWLPDARFPCRCGPRLSNDYSLRAGTVPGTGRAPLASRAQPRGQMSSRCSGVHRGARSTTVPAGRLVARQPRKRRSMSLPDTRHETSNCRRAPAPDSGTGRGRDDVIVGHWLANGGSLVVHAPGEPCNLCQRAADSSEQAGPSRRRPLSGQPWVRPAPRSAVPARRWPRLRLLFSARPPIAGSAVPPQHRTSSAP